jgi:hypothetical protein
MEMFLEWFCTFGFDVMSNRAAREAHVTGARQELGRLAARKHIFRKPVTCVLCVGFSRKNQTDSTTKVKAA